MDILQCSHFDISVTTMSKPKTGRQQFEKTQSLLREIYARAGLTWIALFKAIDAESPGLVSGDSHLRQLGNGHRFLSDTNLAKLATWALLKNWGDDQARAAIAYTPPSQEELDEIDRAKRHDQYLQAYPLERIIEGPMRTAAQEKTRAAVALDVALANLSPAGFSHADILYMVHSWLIKNPPTNKRGRRQRDIVIIDGVDGRGLDRPVFPESLPSNFSIPDHRDGHPCSIEFKILRPWADFQFPPSDKDDE